MIAAIRGSESMKERDLQIDRSCHVVYSKPCKKQIQEKIARHYPQKEREEILQQGKLKVWYPEETAEIHGDWQLDLVMTENAVSLIEFVPEEEK